MRRFPVTLLLAAAAVSLDVAPALAAEWKRGAQAASVDTGHVVRHAPGAHASSGRHGRRHSLAYFAHLTDTHIADEASPARHERLYGQTPMFGGFWRPQEAFGPHVVDQAVRAVNRRRISAMPSAGGPAPPRFAPVTGDLADNAPGKEGRYAGVRASRRALGRWPGSLDLAQRPFVAEGLAVPWFSVRGNHDALPQGHYGPNVVHPRSAPTGCRKVMSARASAAAAANPWGALRRVLPRATVVPPDPRRRFLRSAAEFRRLHGTADQAHGFGLTPPSQRRRSR